MKFLLIGKKKDCRVKPDNDTWAAQSSRCTVIPALDAGICRSKDCRVKPDNDTWAAQSFPRRAVIASLYHSTTSFEMGRPSSVQARSWLVASGKRSVPM